ncbi:hypothetical protein, conserved [Eimeria maxima]|uniref:Uncharacterized protein n=1 Tax=Eimeria maxima TaxID=5804 RepID=U6M524_EIMMA|nr:hypothetical protein, conserved [Eimeria maxima]CDJ56785.1 hypothetical protein, conserved [Eimeria maxima]
MLGSGVVKGCVCLSGCLLVLSHPVAAAGAATAAAAATAGMGDSLWLAEPVDTAPVSSVTATDSVHSEDSALHMKAEVQQQQQQQQLMLQQQLQPDAVLQKVEDDPEAPQPTIDVAGLQQQQQQQQQRSPGEDSVVLVEGEVTDSPLSLLAEAGTEEDPLEEDLLLPTERLTLEGERLPLKLSDGTSVGELQVPLLDRQRRKLRGLKTLSAGLLLFLYLLTTRRGGPLTLKEQTAMTVAFVGLVHFLESLFRKQGEFQFTVSVHPKGPKEDLVGLVEYGGLTEAKQSAASRIRKALRSSLVGIPTFFLVSGLFMTLGFPLAAGILLGVMIFILGGLASLISGAGGTFADLLRSF